MNGGHRCCCCCSLLPGRMFSVLISIPLTGVSRVGTQESYGCSRPGRLGGVDVDERQSRVMR